ncbi:MAG: sulfite exporter TauE/SafE family protein [Desulfobacteraceae bacterium]|jgi:uncharacterized membrane protein YfcA|nr:sulfite exporter TauE/SafE family protein [Desulfobacteraceae bacterium]
MNQSIALMLFFSATVMAAGYVRGYGGFGFSMITVAALSLFCPPAQVVPVVLLLEVAASLFLLPGIWRLVNWAALSWLLTGVAAGTPVGVWMLGNVSPAPMKMAVAVIIFTLALMLRQGFVVSRRLKPPATMAAGVASGVLNGAAAIGGPPAILFFFSSPVGAAVSRASLIAFFLITDILAAGFCVAAGLMTLDHAGQALILALPMAAGLFLGKLAFMRTPETVFQKRVLSYLMILSLMTLVRSTKPFFS